MGTYLTQITNYLLTQSWQIAVLVVVVAAATYALRNRSAHVRYLLWLIVLAKCLAPPLLEVPVAVLPERAPVAAAFTIPMPAAAETMPETTRPLEVAPIVAPVAPSRPQLSARQWLAIGWLAGVLAFACIAAVKAWRTVRWLHRERRPLPRDVQTDVDDLLAPLNPRRLPKMWLLEGIGQPFVWGALQGDIYLPARFVRIPDDEHRRHVLGHELSHVMRFDAAVNLAQTMAQAILWFHPFVWWANKKIRAEREKCCDEMAIARLNAQATDYSRAIVDTLVTEYESTRPVPSLAVAGPVRNVEERIKIMLTPGKRFYKRPSLIAAISVILIALLTVPTALVLTARAAEEIDAKSGSRPTKSLHHAAAEGDVEQVKKLIAAGAAINAKDSDSYTPLHRAVQAGNRAIVTLLINKGADVNAPGRWTARPLHAAAWEGHVELVKLLIARGADVNAWQNNAWTPLHSAAAQGHEAVAEILIAGGADVNLHREGGIPLHTAAGQGHVEMAAFLIDKGADMNAKDSWGGTPLMEAAENGHAALAKFLTEKGANVNARNENDLTALHQAAQNIRNRDIVALLIDEGADVNARDKDGETPADFAFDSRLPYSNKIVKLLVEKGAAISKLGGVYLAAYLGDISGVKVYLKQGKEVNAANEDGKTPLQIAAMAGEREMLEFLIANGADINMKDHAGSTALDYARCHQHFDIAKLLVTKGATSTVPKGWLRRGSHPKDYAMTVDRSDSHRGKASAHIKFTGDKPAGFGTLMQSFRADDYRDTRVQMSAWMKTQEAQSAQLWMRLDGVKTTLGFDNMDGRPVKGTTQWHKCEITLDVPQNTLGVSFGAFVDGAGQAWVDDFTFSVVGKHIPVTNMLSQNEMNEEHGVDLERKSRAYPQQPANLDFEDPGATR